MDHDGSRKHQQDCDETGSAVYIDVDEEVTVVGVENKEGITIVSVHDEKNYTVAGKPPCTQSLKKPDSQPTKKPSIEPQEPKKPDSQPTKKPNVKPQESKKPDNQPTKLPSIKPQEPKKPTGPSVDQPGKGQKEEPKHDQSPQHKPGNSTAPSARWCPSNLDGDWESPRLIIPVDEKGSVLNHRDRRTGIFSDSKCSVYDFYIDPRFAGKACTAVWLFPEKKQLGDWNYTLEGTSGMLSVYHMEWKVNNNATWDVSAPGQLVAVGPVLPGLHWSAMTMECQPRRSISYMLCGTDVSLEYVQDHQPHPFGFYIRAC